MEFSPIYRPLCSQQAVGVEDSSLVPMNTTPTSHSAKEMKLCPASLLVYLMLLPDGIPGDPGILNEGWIFNH